MPGFRCYLTFDGENDIDRWYHAQPPNVRGAVIATLSSLSRRPRHLWRRKPFGTLKGPTCLGLGEIRVEEPKGSHHRILGFFDGATSDFVLVYAFAKDADPAYLTACPEAQTRRMRIEQNRSRARACHFPTGGFPG